MTENKDWREAHVLKTDYILTIHNAYSGNTNSFKIVKIAAFGGTSLVYLAFAKNVINDGEFKYPVIVKECFPAYMTNLKRSDDGHTLVTIDGRDPVEDDLSFIVNKLIPFEKGFEKHAEYYKDHSATTLPRCYFFGRANNTEYAVFDYVEGMTLSDLRNFKELDLFDIASIMMGVCEHIENNHKANEVYLDAKPDNFYCYFKKESLEHPVFTIDFDSVCSLVKDPISKRSASLTPIWAAPEQREGRSKDIGFHSDIYAIGLIFYWFLTGDNLGRNTINEIESFVSDIDRFDWSKNSPVYSKYKDKTGEIKRQINTIIKMLIQTQINDRESSIETIIKSFRKLYQMTMPKEKIETLYEKQNDIEDKIDELKDLQLEVIQNINLSKYITSITLSD